MSSNAEIEKLDAEIAALEAQLADCRRKRDELAGPTKGEEEPWEIGTVLTVTNEAEMTLAGMPDFVRALLDALPVSVFLKEEACEIGYGRRFTYINSKARSKLRWDNIAVTKKYDSEAFADKWESPHYQKMLDQETKTLKGKVSRETELLWSPDNAPWRIAPTIEIPIFKSEDRSKPIGFCAIAREDDFENEARFLSWTRSVYHHEYTNFVWSPIQSARRQVNKFHSAALAILENSPNEKKALLRELNLLTDKFLSVEQEASTYNNTVKAIFIALEPSARNAKKHLGAVLDVIETTFQGSSAHVKIDRNVVLDKELIDSPDSVTGIIIVLILNAIKHSPQATSSESNAPKEVRIVVTRESDAIRFSVRNHVDHEKRLGKLVVETADERTKRNVDPRSNLSGAIMGEMLKRAFVLDADERKAAITQPELLDGQWVKVDFIKKLRAKLTR